MSYTIGIDVGTNSIGWAVFSSQKGIVDLGSHIFPVGVQEDSYDKSHAELSRNMTRREQRGIRRGYFRYKLRRKKLCAILQEKNMMPGDNLLLTSQNPPEERKFQSRLLYTLRRKALDEQISLQELGRLLYWFNQRRGFRSSRKDQSSDDKGTVKTAITDLEKRIKEAQARTVGEYFAMLYPVEGEAANLDVPRERIRKQYVARDMYIHEFNEIWKKQATFYPDILTDELQKAIRDEIIFYQRPLKSQRHSIAFCIFEKRKKVAPVSSFAYQEFRLRQTLANLRYTSGENLNMPLTSEQTKKFYSFLNVKEKITKTQAKKLLGLGGEVDFNDVFDTLKGNTTVARLVQVLGEETWNSLSDTYKEWLWHTLYSSDDDELMKSIINKKDIDGCNISDEVMLKGLCKISFEKDYGRLSKKALGKLLPFMREGKNYYEACLAAGYNHTNADVAVRLQQNDTEEHKISNISKVIAMIKNPLVQRSATETMKVIRTIRKKYPIAKVKIEFARSLAMPKSKREKIHSDNKRKHDEREKNKQSLQKKFNLRYVSDDILKKYELYLECNYISLYSGNTISLDQLMSNSSPYQVDHIIPYSRSLDNSFSNLIIAETQINQAKGNKTPFEYFANDPEGWKSFKKRAYALLMKKSISKAKYKKLTAENIDGDFLNSQLNNTAYTAKVIRKACEILFGRTDAVEITNGHVTSLLRRMWGLNTILNDDNAKNRNDHRHHAIDAAVIAATSMKHIQFFTSQAAYTPGKNMPLNNKELPEPSPQFREQIKELAQGIIISYRKDKRLLSVRKNPYKYSQSNNIGSQTVAAPRGSLHNDSYYGRITDPATGQHKYVIRKPLESIKTEKQAEEIVDETLRKVVVEALRKGPLAPPLYLHSKDGKQQIPVKSVRIFTTNPNEELRPGVFVQKGNNYGIALYGSYDEPKRAFETVAFLTAVQRATKGKDIFMPSLEGKPFLMFLQQGDVVAVYEHSPDEINFDDPQEMFQRIFRVFQISVDGRLILARHWRAGVNVRKDAVVKSILSNEGSVLRKNVNTLKALKVSVDILGKIHRI